MISDIVNGITAALHAAFPEGRIYPEDVRQGLREPCFLIRCIDPSEVPIAGGRYWRNNLFTVKYIPLDGTHANDECYTVQDKLFRVLEYISVAGKLKRGTGMHGEIIDGILHFYINYNQIVRKIKQADTMDELRLEPMEVTDVGKT